MTGIDWSPPWSEGFYRFSSQGWQCPGCQRCYSPSTIQCFFCPGSSYSTGTVTLNPCVHEFEQITAGSHCKKCGIVEAPISP